MNRPIDYVGRVVIPAEIRKELNLEPEDILDIAVLRGQIILTPKKNQCKICNATHKGLSEFGICYECTLQIIDDYREGDIREGE